MSCECALDHVLTGFVLASCVSVSAYLSGRLAHRREMRDEAARTARLIAHGPTTPVAVP
jgi:hypothetical protein